MTLFATATSTPGTYGTWADAATYFASRLHELAWSAASLADQNSSLLAATRIIDALNFKGCKSAVHTLLLTAPESTVAEIQAAEASQLLEFPRDADTVVPRPITEATYEIAYALLDGKDPDLELENLVVNSMTYGNVKTVYERTQLPLEHIVNGVPSATAWRMLKPFLREATAVKLSRVS